MSRSGPNSDVKCSRVLAEDTPDLIVRMVEQFEEAVSEFCFKNARGAVLDIGCGTGNILIRALDFPEVKGIDYVGVDFSRNMLVRAARRTNTLRNVSFVTASAASLPFRDCHFDRVICSGVRSYSVHDLEHTLREYHRVLKPKGVLVKDFFNQASHTSFLGKMLRLSFLTPQNWYMSPSSYRNQFHNAGFRVLDYRGFDFKPVQGVDRMSTLPKWLRILVNPAFVQERLSRFIELTLVPWAPSISFLGYRIYMKCARL